MGQRLIISENERSQINEMYGLVNEKANMDKQVAGPFSRKGDEVVKYYIYQIGSKFYIYQTNASQKEPTLMDGTAWDNDGKGYPNEMEAKKMIDSVLRDPKSSSIKMKPKMSEELDESLGLKIKYLTIPEIESLAKEIVGKLDDNHKKLLRRLDMTNEKQRMILINEILELIGFNTDQMGGGPLG